MDNLLLLAGLSESGKSEAGEYLGAKEHSERVKFVRVVLHKELQQDRQLNPYGQILFLSNDEIVHNFWENFQSYFYNPDKANLYVIESVLSPDAITSIVDKSPGFDVKTVYFHIPENVRIQRQIIKVRSEGQTISVEDARAILVARDKKKIALGAHKILDIADIVIHNNGSLQDFHNKLDSLYESIMHR